MLNFVFRAVVMGVFATAVIDLWALLLQRAFAIAPPNWALVGRWAYHAAGGAVVHDDIARAEPHPNELAIGWAFHYGVGILFAVALLLFVDPTWKFNPTLLPPLLVGWITIACGWFILQPGMGAGIAASKRANAWQIRGLNVVSHTLFGLALYVAALLLR